MRNGGGVEAVLVGRILSDDAHGDIPLRRYHIASEILARAQVEEPAAQATHVWVLNRIRNSHLLQLYRDLLRVEGAPPAGTGAAVIRQSDWARTVVLEIPFRWEELASCESREAAILYLANPNLARNALLKLGAERHSTYTFVLDGDIYVPPGAFRQAEILTDRWSSADPLWFFTMRAGSLDQFMTDHGPAQLRRELVDTCESRFILNSWPPRVLEVGDEGMLGLPRGAPMFDERLEYGNDPKVAYSRRLKAFSARLLHPSEPVCHIEHRILPNLPADQTFSRGEELLLEHRASMRRATLAEMSSLWCEARTSSAAEGMRAE